MGSGARALAIALIGVTLVVGLVLAQRGGYLQAMPLPPAYRPGAGREFCQDVAVAAQHRSSQWLVSGAATIILGVLCASCGAMIGPGSASDKSVKGKLSENRNALLALLGALAASLGYGLVQRSDAATLLAADSTASLALDEDQQAYKACILARADWLRGRADHSWLDSLPTGQAASATPPTKAPP
jgi:hypothetical protein